MRIIDSQIHLWQGAGAPPHHHRAPFTIDDALREMDVAGVDRAVNCPPVWDQDGAAYGSLAAQIHPTRFAMMPWFALDVAADEAAVHEALDLPGSKGLRFLLVDPAEVESARTRGLDAVWGAAQDRGAPIALMVLPESLGLVGELAAQFPRLRLIVDHLGVLPWLKLPGAAAHLPILLELGQHDNISVKASGVPSMATDPFPFGSTREVLAQVHAAFGAERMFWGTDITRMTCSWAECVAHFVGHLDFLNSRDLELVMGDAFADTLGWA